MRRFIPWTLSTFVLCAFAMMISILVKADILGGILCIVCAIATIPIIVEQYHLRNSGMWVFVVLALLFVFIAANLFGLISLF